MRAAFAAVGWAPPDLRELSRADAVKLPDTWEDQVRQVGKVLTPDDRRHALTAAGMAVELTDEQVDWLYLFQSVNEDGSPLIKKWKSVVAAIDLVRKFVTLDPEIVPENAL